MKYIEYLFSNIWIFIGNFILIFVLFVTIMNYLFAFYKYFLRHRCLMKNGYPPPHCNVDGDIEFEENNK